jgi:hypothetical protein
MNLIAYRDVPFKDEEAFKHFMDVHWLDHQEINNEMLRQGYTVPWLPIGSENGLTEVWLDFHNRIHTGIDESLNIASADFSFLDTSDEQSFNDWCQSHSQQHLLYEQALGMT